MKKIILASIILILSLFIAPAQELSSFFPQNKNVERWKKEIPLNIKIREVQKLSKIEELEWVFNSLSSGDTSIMKNFLILDFNNDGVNDLLYQGYLGSQSEYTFLFKGTKSSYEKTLFLEGRIFSANLPNANQALSFAIYNYGCCMGRVDFVEYYTPLIKHDTIQYVLQQREAFILQTVFPTRKLKNPISFKTIQDTYKLRLGPNLDDTTELWTEEEGKGNAIAEYSKGSAGIALAEQKDNTGRTWWFVKMINNKLSQGMFYHGDNNKESYFSYGWMSSRYLDASLE